MPCPAQEAAALAARGDRLSGARAASRSAVLARHGAIATSHPLATQIGLRVLEEGGSAVDAALAANAALGLMEPTGCGIGGDLFALVWDPATKRLHGLNGSGRSPRSLTLEKLRELAPNGIPPLGPLPISVPGCVDAWIELHAKFGKLALARLLAPAIAAAEEGFPVTELVAHYWALSAPRLGRYEEFSRVFLPGGRSPREAELFKNPDLARSYRAIAARGRAGFYEGDLAERIVHSVQRAGGFLALEDLAAHRSEWQEPLSTTYRGVRVFELPPNGQGLAALQMLNLLEQVELGALRYGSAAHLHALIEAKKIAFADRARLYADPAFAKAPLERLLSKEYARERWKLFDPQRAAGALEPGAEPLKEGDTIYLCAADANGMMVSWIQSNFRGMGSGIVPDGAGFVLQDRGELFALDPAHPNCYAPGKRPFHTIIPGFAMKDGEPWLAFGVMGGDLQPQGHVQLLTNLIDFRLPLQAAGDAARWAHDGSADPTGRAADGGGITTFESGFPDAVLRELESLGHRTGRKVDGYGGFQAIQRGDGVWIAASEGRKDGQAAGY
ncbi:MAG: gamma-glutamyltransferase family protein [Planctomycetes bacterium]|nr:gamma-glutamyltransferase family protein [Planctomycetota bacterium]